MPKRHVVPQVIEHSSMSEIDEDNRRERQQQQGSSNFENLTTSLAASLAVSATQPFLKVQNELENKLNEIVKQLDGLKKNPNEDYSENEKAARLENDIGRITEMRLKYIEALQEKQFALITHLISAMSTPGNNVDSVNGRENVNRLLEDYKSELRSVHDDNVARLNEVLEKANLRPRTPSKGNKKSKLDTGERKKSRSRSGLGSRVANRSHSPLKAFEPEFGCLQCSIDKLDKGNLRVKNFEEESETKSKFLEQLLESNKHDSEFVDMKNFGDDKEVLVRKNESKSVKQASEPVFDLGSHQSLFDKYLVSLKKN